MNGSNITGDTLSNYLTSQGFLVVEHNTAINSMRMWLAKVGLFSPRGWDVDIGRKEALLGLSEASIPALAALTEDQQAFVLALCRINPDAPFPAADVRKMAESIVGHTMARASLPKNLLEPLKKAGLIDYETGGTSSGKTSKLWTTPQFNATVLEPFIKYAVPTLDTVLTAYYKRPLSEIYEDLSSSDSYTKGQALEAFAAHIMRLMGLRLVFWRKRAKESTAQAEIDVVMTGLAGGLPTRWQVQCKNTPSTHVDLEDVAKEVGLLPATMATHIMVIANCEFTKAARDYANEVMKHSPVAIFLLNKNDFERIKENPVHLFDILRTKADQITAIQRSALWRPELPQSSA